MLPYLIQHPTPELTASRFNMLIHDSPYQVLCNKLQTLMANVDKGKAQNQVFDCIKH